MLIKTKSGSVYKTSLTRCPKRGPILTVIKDGMDSFTPVIGVFPDRLDNLEATVTTEYDAAAGKVIGRNAVGTITLRFVPTQIKVGMVLANRRGFRSTEIVSVS